MVVEGSSVFLEGSTLRFAMTMAKQYRVEANDESDNKLLIDEITGVCKLEIYCDILIAYIY